MVDSWYHVPIWFVIPALVTLLLLAGELGWWAGLRHSQDPTDRRVHTNVLLGAQLGVLGLLLGFSFSIVEKRWETRKQVIVQEANAIGTTWLRAGMLPEPHRAELRERLREYGAIRAAPMAEEDLERAIFRSEALHDEMWAIAQEVASAHPDSLPVMLFVDSLNQLIDIHETRLNIGVYARLPGPVLYTVLLMALAAMVVKGYSAGLSQTRVWVPSLAMVVAISAPLVLIMELDRPRSALVPITLQPLIDIEDRMERPPVSPGPAAAGPRAGRRASPRR